LKASKAEFNLPKPSYTADTLAYLSEKYTQHQFTIIMGSDSILNIEKWKNYNYIINNFNILIFQRPSFPYKPSLPNIKIVNAPLLEISSTNIRQLIKEKKSIKYLVTDVVLQEINTQQYYSSTLENKAE
jgi:nicotinate-nucleotide adenylyltransferase